MWKSLELQAREALGYYKQNLLDHSGRSTKDQNAEENVDSKGLAHGASEGNKDPLY